MFATGVFAGGVTAIAGGGNVISFPVLLFLGIPAVPANVSNQVGMFPGLASGTFGFKEELTDSSRFELALALPGIVGGVLGAALLLRLNPRIFSGIAPYLVIGASLLLGLREAVDDIGAEDQRPRSWPWWLISGGSLFLISIYGGFFGGGQGILVLAALGLMGFDDIHRMNGLKNLIVVCIRGATVVFYIIRGAIIWTVALTVGAGTLVGAFIGARLAYRVGRTAVSRVVVAVGVSMGVLMIIRLYTSKGR